MLLRKLLLTTALLSTQIFSVQVKGDIDIRAFKGVQEKIDRDYQHLNPLWGQVALDSRTIYNLRFYGDFKAAYYENAKRFYVRDSSDTDPVWSLIKVLFPSVTGTIATTTSAETNFARYVGNPKTVALLLKAADDARRGSLDKAKAAKEVVGSMEFPDNYKKRKIKDITKRTIRPLIQNLEQSVRTESDDSFYPEYFTETVLSAFFVKKFNNQMDVWNLLKTLNDVFAKEIVTNIPSQDDLLSLDDVVAISAKDKFTTEDVYNLLNADIFSLKTPYRENQPLMAHEIVCAFIRKTETIDPKHNFTDCAETAIRHLLNLVFYEPNKKSFDLSRLEAIPEENRSKFYRYLVEFYELQPSNRANDSSKDVRIGWNKVVADMNDEVDEIQIRYLEPYDNETDTGFINLVRILQKVFNLQLQELPQEKGQWKTWLTSVLPKVFLAINPKLIYEFDFKLTQEDEDLYGTVMVTVSKDQKPQFSFVIEESLEHAHIRDLKESPRDRMELEPFLEQVQKSDVLRNLLPYQNGLLLLAGQRANHEPYATFFEGLGSDTARIKWLTEFLSRASPLNSNRFLQNVVAALPWDDPNRFHLFFMDLERLISDPRYRKTALSGVVSLYAYDWTLKLLKDWDVLTEFTNLKKISFAKNVDIVELSAKNLPINIETIWAGIKNLRNVSLKGFAKLKKINLKGSGISTLIFDNLPALEDLDLSSTKKIKEAELKDLKSLRFLDLKYAGISTLTLENLPALENLDLYSTKNLKELALSNFDKLKFVNLSLSNIGTLKLANLPALEGLDVSLTKNLKELALLDFDRIKFINLSSSRISALTLENLSILDGNWFYLIEGIGHLKLSIKGIKILKNLVLGNIDLRNSDFSNTELIEVTFEDADLEGVSFNGAVFDRVDFLDANLDNTDFRNTNITHEQLRRARSRSGVKTDFK